MASRSPVQGNLLIALDDDVLVGPSRGDGAFRLREIGDGPGLRQPRHTHAGVLLGLVLEAVYQESWKDVVERLVQRPVGMAATTAWLSRVGRDRVALPHEGTPAGAAWRSGRTTRICTRPARHFASARDLARRPARQCGRWSPAAGPRPLVRGRGFQ